MNKDKYPIYGSELNLLTMTDEDKEEQKHRLESSFGLKKAINYKLFNSLE